MNKFKFTPKRDFYNSRLGSILYKIFARFFALIGDEELLQL